MVLDDLDVDLARTEPVVVEHGDETYEVLQEAQREALEEGIRTAFGSESFESFREVSDSWKEGSYSDEGQTFERIASSFVTIDCELRNANLDGRGPNGKEPEVGAVLESFSEDFIREKFGDRVVSYRGIHTYDGLASAVVESLDPTCTTSALECTKVVNFTTERNVADYHGTLVVEKRVSADSVVLAADFLLPYLDGGEIHKPEAEIRVAGDQVESFPSDNLLPPGLDTPVEELFDPNVENTPREDDLAAGILKILSEENETIPYDETVDRVLKWFDSYARRNPLAALNLRGVVEDVTDEPVGS